MNPSASPRNPPPLPGLCTLHDCADGAALARDLAREIARQLRQAVTDRGDAVLAVSGGRSPVPMWQELRRQALPWAQTTVLLVDERIVAHDHPDSNAGLVRRHLLQGPAAAAQWLPFFDALPAEGPTSPWTDARLEALARAADRRVAAIGRPIDVAVLGMGEDGHTASWFAGAAGLDQALGGERQVTWTRPASAPHARLTLTLPALLSARTVMLSLQGKLKKEMFTRACTAPTPDLPISLVLHQARVPVQVWMAP